MSHLTCPEGRRVMVLGTIKVIHREDGTRCFVEPVEPELKINGQHFSPWMIVDIAERRRASNDGS